MPVDLRAPPAPGGGKAQKDLPGAGRQRNPDGLGDQADDQPDQQTDTSGNEPGLVPANGTVSHFVQLPGSDNSQCAKQQTQ